MNRPEIHTAEDMDTPLTISFDDVLCGLTDGEIEDEYGLMRWGSNYTFLVTVKQAKRSFMAIYKPRMGERPLWDFPDGTLCQRETAAYVVSEMLGWCLVPPTVLRDGPRGVGSLQVFINHDPQQHYFTLDKSHSLQVKRIATFDAIVNNADRKGGHCLLDENERLWGIDHGLTFHPTNKLRTVIWDYAGKAIPADYLKDIQTLCHILDDRNHTLTQQLCELISKTERLALQSRVNRLLQTGKFPLPGPGPNRPWPAI